MPDLYSYLPWGLLEPQGSGATMPNSKKATPPPVFDACILYNVSDPDVSSLAHKGNVYPVVDGKVSIPKGETWHLDLVGGLLKE
jgi:hypothetical protein